MFRLQIGWVFFTCISGFQIHPHSRFKPGTSGRNVVVSLLQLQQNNDDDSFQDKLDTLFFDPDQVLKDNEKGQVQNPISLWFANLMKDDYETAEIFFAATFLSIMVVVSQELLRMQIYGDHYIPFSKGTSPGSLF
jgi:hypothetical protein